MVMAIVQAAGVLSVADTAAAISVLAFLNVFAALISSYRHIDKRIFICLTLGQVPAIGIGLFLLDYVGDQSVATLEILFGVFLIAGGFTLARDPTPKQHQSSRVATVSVGFVGGLFGGLFAASGPIVGWFAYQQPILIASIRASLLAMLGVTTLTRTTIVAIEGVFTQSLVLMILAAVPVVAVVTYFATRFPPKLSDQKFRQGIFSFVFLIGLWILGAGVLELTNELL